MNPLEVGNAIKTARKRRGLTQHELAEMIDVTDKAVSRWERGIGLPDISIVNNLAWNLNVDVNNLLEGNVAYLEKNWIGILAINNTELRIPPDSYVFDKPIVHIWLSYFVLAGIRTIYVVGQNEVTDAVSECMKAGTNFGLAIRYSNSFCELPLADYFVVTGSMFLYGNGLTRFFQRGMSYQNGISELVIPHRYSDGKNIVKLDSKNALHDANSSLEPYLRLPFYFVPRGTLKLIDKQNPNFTLAEKLIENRVIIGKGLVTSFLNELDDLLDVSNFICFMQRKTGYYIYCLEEICWRRGLINSVELIELTRENAKKLSYVKSLFEV